MKTTIILSLRKTALSICFILLSAIAFSQSGVNTDDVDDSAILHLESTDKGFLLPSLTEVQITSMPNPAKGLVVFNGERKCLGVNIGTPAIPDWQWICGL